MLPFNYVLFMTLETSLALPSATATAAVSTASLASASVIIVAVILVLVIQCVSLLRFPLPASWRRGRRVILALASVDPKEVGVAAFDLQLPPDSILCTLHSDEQDAVALHMPLTTNLHMMLRLIVKFVDGGWRSCAFPPKERHLWCSLEKSML
jgi:hypothetical protein